MKNNKICITFAGAIGSSKTPIANYLSTKLNLPIFNNDAIRTEVIEDFGFLNNEEHLKRRNSRLDETIKEGISFICDVSIDRQWKEFKKGLVSSNYKLFIISLDLSKKMLIKLYKAKSYFDSLKRIDQIIQDHNNFLNEYSDDINLHITDKDFINRIHISYNEVKKFLYTIGKNENKLSQ